MAIDHSVIDPNQVTKKICFEKMKVGAIDLEKCAKTLPKQS